MRKKILCIIGIVILGSIFYFGLHIVKSIFKDLKSKSGKGMEYVTCNASLEIDHQNEPLKLNLSQNIQQDYFQSIENIKIIAPETTDESLIGTITNLSIVHDTLFIVDAWKARAIFAFDLSGKFLYKIEKIGKGPGEYQSINSIQFTNEQILILDWTTWKFIRYDLKGNLLSEHLIAGGAEYFAQPANGPMILVQQRYSKKNPCRLKFIDSTFNILQTAFPFKNTRDIASSRPIVDKNKILFFYPLCDTIYEIEGTHISPKYYLSFYEPGQIEEFIDVRKDLDNNEFLKQLDKSNLVNDYQLINMDNYLFIQWQITPKWYHSIIRKSDGKSITFLAGNTKAKEFFALPCNFLGVHHNILLGYTDSSIHSKLPQEYLKKFYALLSPDDIKLVDALKESDNNPLVFYVSMKQF